MWNNYGEIIGTCEGDDYTDTSEVATNTHGGSEYMNIPWVNGVGSSKDNPYIQGLISVDIADISMRDSSFPDEYGLDKINYLYTNELVGEQNTDSSQYKLSVAPIDSKVIATSASSQYNPYSITDVASSCYQAFIDTCHDPVTVPALKQTGGAILIGAAVVVTGGLAGQAPTISEASMIYISTTADLVSPGPPATLGGAMGSVGLHLIFGQ